MAAKLPKTTPAVVAPGVAAAPAKAAVAVTAPPAPAAPSVVKAKTGDEIVDTANEIESLSKVKALNLAEKLVNEQGANDFKLGGVFLKIKEQGWFDGFESFEAFVSKQYGFATRKAYYLMEIYSSLTEHNIPWEKVKGLGWTKLSRLTPVLTSDNVDEWVKKASSVTVVELEGILKAGVADGGGETNVTGTSDTVTFKIKLKKDQLDTVTNAIAKAKAEIGTEFDAVGLESFAAGYLGGTVSAAAGSQKPIKQQMAEMGWQPALEQFVEMFPGVDLTVTRVNTDPTAKLPDLTKAQRIEAAKAALAAAEADPAP